MNIRQMKKSLIIIVAVAWAAIAVASFVSNLSGIQTQSTNDNLTAMADANAADVRFVFERYIRTLSAVAKSVEHEHSDELRAPSVILMLDSISKEDSFLRLAIDNIDGTSYTSDGYVLDVNKWGYADKIKAGKPFILDVADMIGNGEPTVSVLVPLKGKDGKYEYALRGAIPTSRLTDMFEETFANAGGYYHVVDGEGRYVSAGKAGNALLMDDENYLAAIEKLTYEAGFSAARIKQDFLNQKSGYSRYSFDGKSRYAYYAPVGIRDWMVLMITPKEVVEQETNAHIANAFALSLQIIVILLIFTLYIYFTQKQAKNIALMNEKSFKILAEHTNKVVFEWDFVNSKMSALSNFQNLFGREAKLHITAEDAISSKNIHRDDAAIFTEVLAAIGKGENIKNARLRVLDSDGIYHWCALSIVMVNDAHGKSYKAIGTLESIDEQVRQENELRRKAEIDQLTGLNNKATTEYLIKEVLENTETDEHKHALLIIDIDNFKEINDKLGHLYGDIVLAQLADLLKSTFRMDDILGRIGGDEFFVLLKNYTAKDLPQKKAHEIANKFCKSYSVGDVSINISVSIGIAIFPENGYKFDELYKAADAALYASKDSGKNCYTVFSDEFVNIHESVRTEIEAMGGIQKSFNENRMEYIFKLLYGTEKTNDAVMSVLQLVAEQFGFSRVNIFEVNEELTHFSCSFEWCMPDVSHIQNNYNNRQMTDFKHIIDAFDKYGDIFIKSTAEFDDAIYEHYQKMNVKFLCYFALLERGKIVGCIAFQDCVHDRLQLNEAQFQELRTICQILATFMLKQRINEREKRSRLALENVMNNMDEYVYVIEQDSMEILYENRNVIGTTQKNSLGNKCYKAYMGKNEQCEVCPLRHLTAEIRKGTVEIHNPGYDIYLRTTGMEIEWFGSKKVYMVSSVDITEYKKQ